MPRSNATDTPTDGNASQWEKVKEMRERHAAVVAGGPAGTPIQVIGIEPPPAEEPPAPPAAEQPRNPDGTFAAKESEAAPAAAAPPKEEKPATPPAQPAAHEIIIDGVKVNLAPELADAFERAEKIKTDTAAATDREVLKSELREELKRELAPAPKSEAELAAEAALRAAEEAKNAPKEPSSQLLIENPDEWAKQNRAFDDYRLEKVRREAKEEALREVRARDATAAKDAEAHARAVVREQFYGNYPVLKDSADIVDIVLTKAMDDLVATGKLNRPLQPAEQEAMKKALFADVATK